MKFVTDLILRHFLHEVIRRFYVGPEISVQFHEGYCEYHSHHDLLVRTSCDDGQHGSEKKPSTGFNQLPDTITCVSVLKHTHFHLQIELTNTTCLLDNPCTKTQSLCA